MPKYASSNDARIRRWEVILLSIESDATVYNKSRENTITGFVVYVGYTGKKDKNGREKALFGLGTLIRSVWYLDLIDKTVSLTASFYKPIELVEPDVEDPYSSTTWYSWSSSTPSYGSSEPSNNEQKSSIMWNGSSAPNISYPDLTTPLHFDNELSMFDVMPTNSPEPVKRSVIRVIPMWAYDGNLEALQKELVFKQLDVVYTHEDVIITKFYHIVTISDPAYINHFTELHFCNRIVLRSDEFRLLYDDRILYYIPKNRYFYIGEFSLVHDPVTFNKTSIGAYVCVENTSFGPLNGVGVGYRTLLNMQAVVLMLCMHTSI